MALHRTREKRDMPAIAAPIARGALLPDAALAARCLDTLAALPAAAVLRAARQALTLEHLPDAYGVPRPVAEKLAATGVSQP